MGRVYGHRWQSDDDTIDHGSRKFWLQANGNYKTITKMDTVHLRNAIALINRKKNWRKDYLPVLQAELDSRSNEPQYNLF